MTRSFYSVASFIVYGKPQAPQAETEDSDSGIPSG